MDLLTASSDVQDVSSSGLTLDCPASRVQTPSEQVVLFRPSLGNVAAPDAIDALDMPVSGGSVLARLRERRERNMARAAHAKNMAAQSQLVACQSEAADEATPPAADAPPLDDIPTQDSGASLTGAIVLYSQEPDQLQAPRSAGVPDLMASFALGPGNVLQSLSHRAEPQPALSDHPEQEAPPLPRQSPRKAVLKKRIQMLQSAARRVIQRDVASKRRFRMRPRKLKTNGTYIVEQSAMQTAAQLEVQLQQTAIFRSAMQALCRHCRDCSECNAIPVPTLQIAPDGELKIGATRAAQPKAASSSKQTSRKKARACTGFSDDDSDSAPRRPRKSLDSAASPCRNVRSLSV